MTDHSELPLSPERRHFLTRMGALGAIGMTGVGLALPSGAKAEDGPRWQNWSGGQTAKPTGILYPDSEDALVRAVQGTKGSLRAFGGGHSFSPVVPTNGTLISLEAMNGMTRHNTGALTATFRAGSRIAQMGPALKEVGQALLNEADINMQSLGGAISTATHGTGRQLQCFSATVTELRLVLADGSIVTCSPEKDRELFEAARVAVGSIGILSEITLQNRAAYRLREQVNVMSTQEAIATLQRDRDKHRHIEFFAFPFGEKAIVKRMDITTDAPTAPVESFIDENAILEFAADSARKYPWTNTLWQRLVGMFVSDSERVGDSHEIFASPRTVGFNEMEYSVPADRGLECFQEILDVMRKNKVNVFFPIEFRYIAADECWLSPFYQRASAAISVHQYYKQDYKEFFRLAEPVFRKYQGRPHWGKLHILGAADFRQLYPRFGDFLKVRERVDPQGRLLNEHARKIFLD